MATPFATTSGSTYDMTSTSDNPDAYPKSTPRQGGFTVKNYINWDSKDIATNQTAAKRVSNVFKILYIPPRSVIRQLRIQKKIGETTIAHAYNSVSGSSTGSGAVLNVGFDFNKSASGSSTVQDIDALADHAITKKTGALPAGAFGTVSASTPWTNVASQSDGSPPTLPFMCPYGGYVTLQLTGGTDSQASYPVTATLAGDMIVEAVCDYQPE